MDVVNSIAWVAANIMVAYIAIVVVLFVVMYYVFFDPRATTSGKMIFRFMLSLVGVIGLIFVSIFLDPPIDRGPFDLTEDVDWWRPVFRLVIYCYVAYSITTLAVALVLRKWFPNRVKKNADLDPVKPRNDTTEIPIIRSDG